MAASRFPCRFGKYTLLRPLARGGMGQIYLAASGDVAGAEKLCVLKKLLEETTPGMAARFLDEAKVVVRLNHGNLVNVFDASMVDDELYLAMELVEGRDLRAVWNQLLQKGRRVPVEVALLIARETCRGLAYAHGYGGLNLVHRDVAPPNVLLSWAGEVKLTDFGLAASKLKSEHTAPGIVFGRLAYLSPEQAIGQEADVRSDVWAVGVILWELLTGRPLHTPEADQKMLLQKVRHPKVEPPSRWNKEVPASLDAVMMTALTVDRIGRYQSAEKFREALAGELASLAPATDGAQIAELLRELWGDDIDRERDERERLLRESVNAIVQQTEGREPTRPIAHRQPSQAQIAAVSRTQARALSPQALPDERTMMAPQPARPTPAAGARMQARSGFVRVQPPSPTPSPATAVEPVEDLDANSYLGQVIDGRYRVERVLGQGGMGWVYEVEHVEIGKKLALKILLPQFSRQADLVARFRREARAASTIGHPNIVDVTDSGTTADGSFYFVMERLEGIELGDVLRHERRVQSERAVHIATQMCRALAAAHAAGIIHRDLKPENVFLVSRDGEADFVKILDFGIAKSPDVSGPRKLTTPGLAMGTPEYMAPEQAAGRAADPRVDVYSVGAILYEMVTGWPPHPGENVMEILTKKATEPPRPPRALNPEVPEALERVILLCLEREPGSRPQSMSQLEYELTKSMKGRGQAVAAVLGIKGVDSDVKSGSWPLGQIGGFGGNTPMPDRLLTPPVVAAVSAAARSYHGFDAPRAASGFERAPTGLSFDQPTAVSPMPGELEIVVEPLEISPVPERATTVIKGGRASRLASVLGGLAFLVAAGALAVRYYQPWKHPQARVKGQVSQPGEAAKGTPAVVDPTTPVEGDDGKREDVAALLEWARRAADGNRLARPAGDNLKDLLARIEAADPGNLPGQALRAKVIGTVKARALAEVHKRKLDEAEADYRALEELDPDDKSLRTRLAGTLALRAKLSLIKNKNGAAIADATAAVEIMPDDASVRMVLADAFFQMGKLDQAIEEYKKVLDQQPQNKRAQKRLLLAQSQRPAPKKKKGKGK